MKQHALKPLDNFGSNGRQYMSDASSDGAKGFTMIELMVTVAILGIVMGIMITESGRAYNRDKLNEASLQLSSWLGEIANEPDTLGQSCTVTVTTGTIASGGQIASVTPTACSSTPTLRLPGLSNLSFTVGATQTSWSFTRRNAVDATSNIDIKLSLSNFTALRCVRVFAISGLLRLGRDNTTSNVSSTCSNWSTI
jgi:prepilin-type N-terminal cleavage/methylation domain-containing protein